MGGRGSGSPRYMQLLVKMLPVLVPALIAILATGWSYYRARKHRQLGLAEALLAEMTVRVKHDVISLKDWDRTIETLIGEGARPFVALDPSADFLAGSVHSELHYLPGEALKPLVRYRELDRIVTESLRRIASEEFMGLEAERKTRFVAGMDEDVAEYLKAGKDAQAILERYVTDRREKSAWGDLFRDRWTGWRPS